MTKVVPIDKDNTPELRQYQLDEEEVEFKPSPETNANPIFKLTFDWLTPLIWKGYKQILEMKDLYDVPKEYHAQVLSERFDRAWEKYKDKKFALLRTLVSVFWLRFLIAGFMKLIFDSCNLLSPFFLRFILQDIQDPTKPAYEGYLWSLGLFGLQLLATFLTHHYFHIVMSKVGLQVRTVLIAKIYQKSCKLSNAARQRRTTGEMVNLMSIDASKITFVITYLHMVWSGIFQISVCLGFLLSLIGWVTFAGVIVIILLMPIQAVVARISARLRRTMLSFTDKRIKAINEILQGMRILKFFTWEESYYQQVNKIRICELKQLLKISFVSAIIGTIMSASPVIVSVVTFVVYAVIPGSNLNADIIFPALGYFGLLRFPLTFFPMIVGYTVDAIVSINRLNVFFLETELEKLVPGNDKDVPIKASNCTFEWEVIEKEDKKKKKKEKSKKKKKKKGDTQKLLQNSPEVTIEESIDEEKAENESNNQSSGVFRLEDISFEVKAGELLCIVGSVGSGKSSLVQGILGEMKKLSGTVEITGSVAYCPQQAWIQNTTVRENITFGKPFDRKKFDEIVNVCALGPDLNQIAGGELAEIGEKGINLSGGQRQRVSIARAVYADADVYIFDDPLSAVDAHVGLHLFEKCINGHLKSKTRILVTHQLQYLPYANQIIVLERGKIVECGTYKELLNKGGVLATLIKEHLAETDEHEKETSKDEKKAEDTSKTTAKVPPAQAVGDKGKLIEIEERARGSVSFKVVYAYIKGLGGPLVGLLIIAIYGVGQIALISTDWWLSQWTSGSFNLSLTYNLLIYGLLGVAGAIFMFFRSLSFSLAGLWAAYKFHKKAFRRILRAPMSFFDATPVGRMLSRFSKDQESIDTVVVGVFSSFLQSLFRVISTFGIIAYVTYWFLIPLVPVLVVYWCVQQLYRRTSRELQRLDSLSRSPLFSHFGETINGIATIRAYNKTHDFIFENFSKTDLNQRAYYAQLAAQRWLGLRLECLGSFLVLCAAIFANIAKDSLSAGLVGLSLTYALQVTQSLSWTVRQATEAETNMNCVERIVHYCEHIPQEAPAIIPSNRPPKNWPEHGEIVFTDVEMKYREDLDPVLNGLNLTIAPGEKVGIVGRTGAGKSSMMLAIYRIVELSGGQITIDGIDISKIGLQDLRSNLSIIPQEPIMFSGTVRFNLDPFNKHDDHEIWDALEKAHLKDVISDLPNQLDSIVTEGGQNFSVGQRQLMCLARALLRKSKILILDEATASVDFSTDALIQKTVREHFKDCTMLTIAHRLNTIIDSDKILVLEKGRVAEFDTPKNLVKNEKSLFVSMLDQTGAANAKALKSIALGLNNK